LKGKCPPGFADRQTTPDMPDIPRLNAPRH
jgi:hypothetical protein